MLPSLAEQWPSSMMIRPELPDCVCRRRPILDAVGHPRPVKKKRRDTQKAPTWCANCRGLLPPASKFLRSRGHMSDPDGLARETQRLYWFRPVRPYVQSETWCSYARCLERGLQTSRERVSAPKSLCCVRDSRSRSLRTCGRCVFASPCFCLSTPLL